MSNHSQSPKQTKAIKRTAFILAIVVVSIYGMFWLKVG